MSANPEDLNHCLIGSLIHFRESLDNCQGLPYEAIGNQGKNDCSNFAICHLHFDLFFRAQRSNGSTRAGQMAKGKGQMAKLTSP
jgi:hypothetical protein